MLTLKFWAEPASSHDASQLRGIIRLGSLYYRRLAEIENQYRKDMRALASEYPGVAVLLEKLSDTEPPLPDDERQAVRAQLTALAKVRSADPEYRAKCEAFNKVKFTAKRQARADSGLAPGAWGTYQRIEDQHDQSLSTHWSNDLSGRRATDEGEVSVHVQNQTVTMDDLMNSRWRFAQVDPERYGLGARIEGYRPRSAGPHDTGRSGQVPAKKLRELRIRVGSEGRTPIWARLHVLMHREPAGAIKWVRVHLRRIGLRYRWSVQIVLEPTSPVVRPAPKAELVAINMGAGRKVDGGMRLGYAIGSDGRHHELVIPDLVVVQKGNRTESRGVVSDRDKAADLASIRALRFSATVGMLREYGATLPEEHWLRVELAHAHSWRRAARLAILARLWSTQRFEGDEAMYDRLQAELKQDRHLYAWQMGSMCKQKRRIDGRVQQWCASLCRDYQSIAVERINVKELREQQDGWRSKLVAGRIQLLAPGRLLETLRRFTTSWGRTLVEIESGYQTQDCTACGNRRNIENTMPLHLTCDQCGLMEDQDITAATNNLRRASAQVQAEAADPLAARQTGPKPRQRTTRKRRQEDRSL